MLFSPKLIYKFNAFPTPIPKKLFHNGATQVDSKTRKTQNKKNLKAVRGKGLLTNKETPISLTTDFSSEIIEARMQWVTYSSV